MSVTKNDGGLKEYLIDLIFPNRCPFCGGFIEYDRLCCEDCFGSILWADDNICLKCGKPFPDKCMCSRKLYYDMCIPAAYYADKARNGIHNLKFKKGTNAAVIFGRVLRDRLDALSLTDKIDIAVPVPMTKRNRYSRGYNQAELIAEALCRDTIPIERNLLKRSHVRTSQHFLSADERSSAVAEQYSITDNVSLKGKTVLLVDDVITTGATLDFCARLIKEHTGAAEVICCVCTTT